MESIPAVGTVAKALVLLALTAPIADQLMPSLVDSVAEWLASLRFISLTESTTEGIFLEFQGSGRFSALFVVVADLL